MQLALGVDVVLTATRHRDGETVGVLTLSRVAPARIGQVPTKYREFAVTAPKVSLVTEYPLTNGENLLAVNVHLLNFELWSLKKITHQLEELKTIMANHTGPIIMAGDFNTWNQKRLELVKEITRDIKLTEVTDFPDGRTTGDTRSEFWNDILDIDRDRSHKYSECVLKAAAVLGPRLFCFYMILAFYIMGKGVAHDR